jgi:hypothetical protein
MVARVTESEALKLALPHLRIRILVGAVFAAGAASAVGVAVSLHFNATDEGGFQLVQGLEAAMNIAILVGLGVLALTRIESGWKRRQALASLHVLRSLAHVVDMHQLTKDPNRPRVESADGRPKRNFAPAELERYLDYCTELLSLVGKLAALYAQSHNDGVVVAAVNEIEVLATNLARKIWQKIALIEHVRPAD